MALGVGQRRSVSGVKLTVARRIICCVHGGYAYARVIGSRVSLGYPGYIVTKICRCVVAALSRLGVQWLYVDD